MAGPQAVALVALGIFAINLPFGWWRARLRKFSPAWFVAIHAPVPIVVALRWAAGIPFDWMLLPLFVAAYFGGQFTGARLRPRSGRSADS